MPDELPLSQVYRLLEPGPVVLLVTAAHGRANLMTLSWHMMMEFQPPLVGCIVSDANFSQQALRASGECVIAIPDVSLAAKVVAVGNVSGRAVDKFASIGLTPLPARRVAPPLVAECFANLECRVVDDSLAERYGLFVLEVVEAWTDPARPDRRTLHHQGFGRFAVDGETITLSSKMP